MGLHLINELQNIISTTNLLYEKINPFRRPLSAAHTTIAFTRLFSESLKRLPDALF